MAIPKGRISEDLNPMLKKIGIEPEQDFFDETSRKLIFSTNLSYLDLIKVRSFDVATFVKFKAADLAICGSDVLEEFSSPEIFSLIDLKIGKCCLSIATKKDYFKENFYGNEKNFDDIITKNSHVRIATKYVAIAKKYFENFGIQAEIVKLNGSIEIAPKLGIADFILDLVSSGKTLAENQMVEVKKILEISSHLIVNRTSLKVDNKKIKQLIKLFDVK